MSPSRPAVEIRLSRPFQGRLRSTISSNDTRRSPRYQDPASPAAVDTRMDLMECTDRWPARITTFRELRGRRTSPSDADNRQLPVEPAVVFRERRPPPAGSLKRLETGRRPAPPVSLAPTSILRFLTGPTRSPIHGTRSADPSVTPASRLPAGRMAYRPPCGSARRSLP